MALRRTYIGTIGHLHDCCRAGLRAARAGIALAALAALASSAAAGGAAASDAVVAPLITRDLIGVPGKEVTMETVEYAPGAKSPPHRHHAQVFVYVLEGSVRMQVQGSPTVTLGPGGTFYESPDDLHTISENASQTKSAKFVVVMVKDKVPAAGGATEESGQGRAEAAGRPLLGLPGPDIALQTIDGKTISSKGLCAHSSRRPGNTPVREPQRRATCAIAFFRPCAFNTSAFSEVRPDAEMLSLRLGFAASIERSRRHERGQDTISQ